MRYRSTEKSNNLLEKYGSLLFLAALLLAALLRFYDLTDRPLHTDEAVNALKFKSLLEEGKYKYDPVEYHGPSLYYLTLIPSMLNAEHTLAETSEFTLRSVTAAAGITLIIFLFLIRKETGYGFLLTAVMLTALSPVLNFYSRYYIHETLLLTFTFCGLITLFLYSTRGKIIWILLSGLFFGLAFSTKETFIIAAGAIILSLVTIRYMRTRQKQSIEINYKHWAGFIFTFAGISIILFTAFFSNPGGIIDAFTTFGDYFIKAGANADHIQPSYYYFTLITLNSMDGKLLSEFILVLLAAAGVYYSFRENSDSKHSMPFKFLSLFTISVMVIYSAIPYKTPWLMITFWQGIILMASYGLLKIFSKLNAGSLKRILIGLTALFVIHMALQVYWTSFSYVSHPDNPFTYSQPQSDLVNASKVLHEITENIEEGYDVYISITAPGHEYWPLPWYFRNYNNISWGDTVRQDVHLFPIVLITPQFEKDLVKNLYEIPPPGKRDLYIPLFEEKTELRPNLELRGYIKKDTYDQYLFNLQSEQ